MRCEDGHDDAAYVLGALSPGEREAYERHLATCSFCREAVADLARVPDLLDRLDAEEFNRLLEPTPPPRRPVRARPVRLLSTVAAAVLAMLIGAGVATWIMARPVPGGPPPGPAVAMAPVAEFSPVTATVRVTTAAGGSRVELLCAYSRTAAKPYTFRLIAYGPDDEREQLGSWRAQPGAEFAMQGVTHFAAGNLSRLELVRFDGEPLLAYDLP